MSDRSSNVRLNAIVGQYQAGMAQAAASTRQVAAEVRGLGGVSEETARKMQPLGLAGVAVGGMIAGGVAVGVKAYADFDAKLTGSLAIMGDVNAQMRAEMAATAREVGRSTVHSAEQAAESYFFLASAGLDAAQSVASLPQVAKFAQAGMFDMALATDLLTDAQSALGLASKDTNVNLANMVRVSDTLVAANTLANATVQQFSEALTNKAANAMRDLNIEVEDGVGILAVWADQGVKGSEAGERFNIVTRDMQTAARNNAAEFARMGIAVFDSAGQFRSLADIVADMESALAGMSHEQRGAALASLGFTDRSIAATRSLLGSSDAARSYSARIRELGGITDEVADKQLETFNAQLGLLMSNLLDLAMDLGAVVLPVLSGLVDVLDFAVDGFRALPGPVKVLVASTVLLTGAVTLAGGSFVLLLPKILQAKAALATLGAQSAATAASTQLMLPGLAAVGVQSSRTAMMLGGATRALMVLGLAVTAATIVYGAHAKRKAELTAITGEFVAALDAESKGVETATRRVILKRLEEEGLLEAARDAGLSTRVLVDAVRGEEDAMREAAEALGGKTRKLFALATVMDQAVDESERLAAAEADLQYAGRGSADTMERLARTTAEARAEIVDATRDTDEFSKTLADLYRGAFGVDEAAERINQGLAEFQRQVLDAKESGDQWATSLDSATESGRNNRAALRDLVQGVMTMADAMNSATDENGNLAHSAEEVAAMVYAQRARLLETAESMGFTREEAADLVDVLLQIKGVGDLHMRVTADTSQAIAAVNAYIATLSRLDTAVAQAERAEAHRFRNQLGITNPPPLLGVPALPRVAPSAGAGAGGGGGGGRSPAEEAERERREWLRALDEFERNMFEHNMRTADAYKRYLDGRLAEEVEFSSEWFALLDERNRVNEQIGQGWLEALEQQRVAEDNLFRQGRMATEEYRRILLERFEEARRAHGYWSDEAQRIYDDIVALDQALIDLYMATAARQFAVGDLSRDRYREMLEDRLADLERYSDEWYRIWQEIARIDDQVAREQQQAADQLARAAQEAAAAAARAAEEAARAQQQAFDRLNRLLDDARAIRRRMEDLTAQHHGRLRDLEERYNADQQQILDDRRRQLLGWADVSQRVAVGWGNSVSALARNVSDQIRIFDEWADELDAARARGVSDAVIDLLGLDEGPEALGQLRMFASATEAEIVALNAAVEARARQGGDRVAEEQTRSYSQVGRQLEDLARRHAAEVEAVVEEFLARQRELRDELAAVGLDQGRSFADAIAEGLRSGIPGIVAAAQAAQAAMGGAGGAGGGGGMVAGGPGGPSGQAYLDTAAGQGFVAGVGRISFTPGADITPELIRSIFPAASFDQGGFLPVGWSLAFNGTGRPEPVGHAMAPTVHVAAPVVEVYLDGQLVTDDRVRVVVREQRAGARRHAAAVGRRG